MIQFSHRVLPALPRFVLVAAIFVVFAAAGQAQAFAPGVPGFQEYEHPSKSPAEQKADYEQCRDKASAMTHARMARGKSQLEFRESDYFDECMRDRGYSPKNP